MINATGLILANDININIGELTEKRSLGAMPFGGRYRLIDFPLSAMVRAGVRTVGVSTNDKYLSLLDHLGRGSNWDLDRNTGGLAILPPYLSREDYSSGGPNSISAALTFYTNSEEKYIIIAGCVGVFNPDYKEIIKQHIESGAKISVLYTRKTDFSGMRNIILEMDRKNIVNGVLVDPAFIPNQARLFTNAIVMETNLFTELLAEGYSRGQREIDVLKILQLYDHYTINAIEFKGVYLRMSSVENYFDSTMKLLAPQYRKAIFSPESPIYTKVKDESPTFYSGDSQVSASIVSDGCVINGTVKNSLLFRGVHIGKDCKITNSIIFQDTIIEDGCELDNCIVDKDVLIRFGIRLIGQKGYPVVIKKGAVI